MDEEPPNQVWAVLHSCVDIDPGLARFPRVVSRCHGLNLGISRAQRVLGTWLPWRVLSRVFPSCARGHGNLEPVGKKKNNHINDLIEDKVFDRRNKKININIILIRVCNDV